MKERDPFFDILKFVAIFMVVLGHVCGHCDYFEKNVFLDNFIVGLNMPLFFVISGYFADCSADWQASKKTFRHIVRYFWPLAVISLLFAIPALWYEGVVEYVFFSTKLFLFTKWFLFALTYCILAVCVVNWITSILWLRLTFFLLLYLLSYFCCDLLFYVSAFKNMFPFFLFGMWLAHFIKVWENNLIGIVCCVLFATVIFSEGNVRTNGMSFYDFSITYKTVLEDFSVSFLALWRVLHGLTGVIGSMWIVSLLLKRVSSLSWIAQYGTTSLGVYLLHSRVVDILPLSNDFIVILLYTSLIFWGCHYFVVWMQKVSFLKKWFWGYF